MDVPAAEDKLLRALAVAVVDHPTGTFKDIAQAAGISKATLNRYCGTRANLIEILLDHASNVVNQIMVDANVEDAPPLDALQRLIDLHLAHRELISFLNFQWKPDTLSECGDGPRWIAYVKALDEFFLRGQRQGAFRIDISAAVLAELFAGMLYGMVDTERRGRVARVGMAAMLKQFFLHGAANQD